MCRILRNQCATQGLWPFSEWILEQLEVWHEAALVLSEAVPVNFATIVSGCIDLLRVLVRIVLWWCVRLCLLQGGFFVGAHRVSVLGVLIAALNRSVRIGPVPEIGPVPGSI